jgi:hypothetical protein
MLTQTVMWTALPNGIVGDQSNRRLRLSVYVSPRLQTDQGQSLGLFQDFLNWPAHLQPGNVTFAAYVSNPGATSAPSGPIAATITSQPPSSALWTALFPSTSPVTSYMFDKDKLNGAVVSSYRHAGILRPLKQGYKNILSQKISGASLVDLPGSSTRRLAFPDPYTALYGSSAGPPAVSTAARAQGADFTPTRAVPAASLLQSDDGSTLAERVAAAAAAARERAQHALPGTFTPLVPNTGSIVSHLNQFVAFHTPPAPATPAAAQSIPVLDFHQALSALSDYPDLLRLLGLVIDLELPATSVPASPAGNPTMQIQIVPTFTTPLAGAPPVTPWTAYILAGDQFFVPAPSTPSTPGQPESIYGLLNLQLTGPDPDAQDANAPNPGAQVAAPPNISLYDLVQVDVDGMAFKALNMARTDGGGSDGSTADDAAGIPSVRTTGISLTRHGRAEALQGQFFTALTNNNAVASKPVTLYAEDLMRGYRIDVHDAQSRLWHSLHQRTGSYTFTSYPGGPHVVATTGEGTAQAALMTQQPTQPDGSPNTGVPLTYIHESLAHWQGWSLSVPRPGQPNDTGSPGMLPSTATADFKLEVAFDVQSGSLPRLRYGWNYAVRARTVDLAGNSLSLQEADALLAYLQTQGSPAAVLPAATGDPTYRRYEPVSAPVAVLRERLTEGESLQRLVIRSNLDEAAATCAARLMKVVAASRPNDRVLYTAANERHLAPPKVALATVEAHGLLDASFGTQAPPAVVQATYNLATKEKGRLSDTQIVDTATGQLVPIPDTTGIDPRTGQAITRPSVEFVATGTSNNQPTGYAIHHEPQLRLPYLPDPLSRGAVLFGLPGLATGQSALLAPSGTLTIGPSLLPQTALTTVTSNTQIDFGADWPERLPFRLQLAEPPNPNGPSAAPVWDPQGRVLTVYVAKAEQVTVRLASFLSEQDLDLLGIWSWLVEQAQTPDANTIQMALAGAMWMLTPFHQLTLVHAVQQPLVAPALQAVSTSRDPGATFAYFGATVSIHGKSTAKLDLLASWTEQVDDPEHPSGPHTLTAQAHVFDVPIDGAPTTSAALQQTPVPVAAYDPAPDVASHDVVTFLMPPQGNGGNQVFLSRHEFGDTKYRQVRYQAVATTRFREYFPSEITGDAAQLTRSVLAVPVDVFSTARPAAPQVLRVLPIFSWDRPPAVSGQPWTFTPGQSQTFTRRSAGVRVYLGRPWYSSGDGELLGVVLAMPASYPPSDGLRPFVSHWGNDPLWGTNPVPGAPQPTDFPLAQKVFPLAQTVGQTLTLLEVDAQVQVAGHAVAFDGTHWYSDVQVNVGAVYSPFVRLALARYQPNSLPGMELSRVVLSDFVQIAPPRTVTVTQASDNHNSFTIQVNGLSYGSAEWASMDPSSAQLEVLNLSPDLPDLDKILPIPYLIDVSVEQRIPGATDEAGWQPADASQAVQIQITSWAQAGQPSPAGASMPLLWNGDVTLPGDRGAGQFRIVIKELEHLASDANIVKHLTNIIDSNNQPDLPDPGKGPKVHGPVREPVDVTIFPGVGRVVFAATIEI